MLRPIVLYGDDVLEKPAELVTNISDAEIQLVQDMVETMYHAPGVGLAANQIGISKRIMVTDPSGGDRQNELITIVNPEIVAVDGEQFEDEGCLSVPGFTSSVVRPKTVILKGVDLNGKEITIEGKDLLARAFCHEMDHLNGIFFLDHLSFIKRDIIKRKIRKLMKQGEWEK
jgi:peptide deformylase